MPKDEPRDLIDWLGLSETPAWMKSRLLGGLTGVMLALFLLFLLVVAILLIVGSFTTTAGAAPGASLGVGGLIVALLGAPFLIWNTIIKHRALGFQKEGHITDRISKAVEQLGAEKTVNRIGRAVTLRDGHPDHVEHDEEIAFRTVIEWQNAVFDPGDGWGVAKEGDWQVFAQSVPNIEVRIGGILSLERIAQDSTRYDRGRDHVRVMEILCAYVRENAPASGAKDHGFGEWVPLKDGASGEERAAHLVKRRERFGNGRDGGQVREWAQTLGPPREDIALALRVIGRRSADQRRAEARWGKDADTRAEWVFDAPPPAPPEPDGDAAIPVAAIDAYKAAISNWKGMIGTYRGYRPDLGKTNLQGADLSGLVLSGANLDESRLEGANLGQARLVGADLRRARLEGADIWQAVMEGAYLGQVRMEGAHLQHAMMGGAYLQEARMEGAHLLQAQMTGSNIVAARMERAHFLQARLEGADIWQARMEGADLWQVRMEGANLWRARMEGANLRQARMDEHTKLHAADLREAALRDADFSTVAISNDQVRSTFGDATVILPPTVSRPAHWPTWKLPNSLAAAAGSPSFDSEYHRWLADPAAYTPPPAP